MTTPETDPFLDWGIRDLMRTAGIDHDEARRIIIATYVTDTAPDRSELPDDLVIMPPPEDPR